MTFSEKAPKSGYARWGEPMPTERDKMLAGVLYDPFDPELVRARERARDFCQDLNATRERDQEARRRILKELFGRGGESVWMQPPFFCDYGSNILLGEHVFFNFNCIVLDVCQVVIGDCTQFGPAVQVYTATHPMNAELRRKQEFAKPIEIGMGWWRGDHLPRCKGRLEVSRRGWECRDEGYPGSSIRCREPVPGYQRDYRIEVWVSLG
jgi:maltose O-acetyltransferase